LDVVDRLRTVEGAHDRLHILLSCRRFDWSRIAGAGWAGHFTPVEIPALADADLALLSTEEAADFRDFLDLLAEPVKGLALSRPILLRMAYELWLQRQLTKETTDEKKLSDITSDVSLWLTYYAECVCAVDVGLVSALTPGEVMKCHDEMARALVEGDQFNLSMPRVPLEASHPKAYPWLRGVEVAVPSGEDANALEVRFFHPSYADFALALALSQDAGARSRLAHIESLSVALHPVWKRIPALWSPKARSAELTGVLLADAAVPYVTKRALLEGWFAHSPSDDDIRHVGPMLLVPGTSQLLADFLEFATSRVEALGQGASATWPDALAQRAVDLDTARLDDLLRDLMRMIDLQGPDLLRVATNGLAAEGFKRAAIEAKADHSLANARILARHAAQLTSRVLTDETIRKLPIEASDWESAGSAQRSTALAADVRQVLVDEDVITRMHAVGLEPTLIFLARVLGAMPAASADMLPVGHHQQTSAVNMSMSLRDVWSASWYSIEQLMPTLLQMDKQYLHLSVLAWSYLGYAWNSEHDEPGEFPVQVAGDHWHHDSSFYWWTDGDLNGAVAHARIASAGFDHVDQALKDGDTAPFLSLCGIAEEMKWAGLAAIALRSAHRYLESGDNTHAATVAHAAASLITQPRTLHVSEVRPAAIAALPFVAEKVDDSTRESLWKALTDLVDLPRIAAEPIAPPNSDKVRVEHADALKRAQDSLAALPDDAENYLRRASATGLVQLLQQVETPEVVFARANSVYERRRASQEAAARGEIPWRHRDVEAFLAATAEFAKSNRLDLLPSALAGIHAQGVQALGVSKMPTNQEAVRYTRLRTKAEPPREASEPRARFYQDVEKLYSTHLNRKTDWTQDEREHLFGLIEGNRDLVGLEEDSPSETPPWNPDDPNWSAQQPVPKKAWVRLVCLYLEHLPADADPRLSAASEVALVRLAQDLDPQSTSVASSAIPYHVRSEAIEALLRLRSKGRSVENLVERVLAARIDPSPSVRQQLYWHACLLRGREDGAYAQILATFAAQETDEYLIELGTHALLYPVPRDDERAAWDAACSALLQRCVPEPSTPLPAKDAGINRMVANRMCGMAFYLAVQGLEQTEAVVRGLIANPAALAANSQLGPAFVHAALEILEDGQDSARILKLLSGYIERARAGSATGTDVPATPAFRSELQMMSEVAGELAASLVGEQAIGQWPLVQNELSTVPRQERLEPAVRAVERDIRALWRAIVDPWIRSPWCPGLQRMLSDALRVARDIAADEPAEAVGMLEAWQLDDRIGTLESAVKDELVELIRVLNPGGAYRRRLMPLLHRLAEVGHAGALALIERVANDTRQT
jgi:hypothetical protein